MAVVNIYLLLNREPDLDDPPGSMLFALRATIEVISLAAPGVNGLTLFSIIGYG
jgi:hypothetical protein